MRGPAYYNENDPFAAAWLRELIKADLIAPGDVDERDIRDVVATDLLGYRQCHFFGGIGVWSYALRCAGWPDDRPVWTGSCPCQPFSQAGEGKGFADERHLWPSWHHLIGQCRPPILFGEQVEATAAKAWIDLVQDDLEALGYAFGAVILPAASVGAPHARHRLFFVADDCGQGLDVVGVEQARSQREAIKRGGKVGSLANSSMRREPEGPRQCRSTQRTEGTTGGHCSTCSVADDDGQRFQVGTESICCPEQPKDTASRRANSGGCGRPVDGFWSGPEWLACRDGKSRPVEPGVSPLAHGAAQRVGRLRGTGNAIVAPVAEAFIRAYMTAP